jgi:hypothetical protein
MLSMKWVLEMSDERESTKLKSISRELAHTLIKLQRQAFYGDLSAQVKFKRMREEMNVQFKKIEAEQAEK